jgi:hypothetical protein
MIEQNNRRESEARKRQYLREQDKAQSYVEKARHDDSERQNNHRKD